MKKISQISVPMSVRFLKDFSPILPLLDSGISLGKKMGKNSSSCMWLPLQLGSQTILVHSVIFGRRCVYNET